MTDNIVSDLAGVEEPIVNFVNNIKSDEASGSDDYLIFPDPISSERINFLRSKGVCYSIARIDLEMVKMKLREKDEGLGWTEQQCESGELTYKRFLHLCKVYGKGIVPTKIMDSFWHFHILDTRSYCSMCDDVFGGYLHHYPYFGMRGEQDMLDLKNAFMMTKERHQKTFGESIDSHGGQDCWHDCEGRCWNECKSLS